MPRHKGAPVEMPCADCIPTISGLPWERKGSRTGPGGASVAPLFSARRYWNLPTGPRGVREGVRVSFLSGLPPPGGLRCLACLCSAGAIMRTRRTCVLPMDTTEAYGRLCHTSRAAGIRRHIWNRQKVLLAVLQPHLSLQEAQSKPESRGHSIPIRSLHGANGRTAQCAQRGMCDSRGCL